MNILSAFLTCLLIISSPLHIYSETYLVAETNIENEKISTHQNYSINQFLNTTSFVGATFLFNEKSIIYSSDETGIFNLYSIPIHGGTKTQLTHSTDHAISIISGFPHDDRILYLSDGLGNEKSHIFLREIDGAIKDLTPDPKARAEFYGWYSGIEGFYFGSNARDDRYMDLYVMNLETEVPTLIFQNNEGWHFGGISNNERYLALNKINTMNDSDIYLYDLFTKKMELITPHTGDANHSSCGFGPDSNELYFITDQNSEFEYLKVYHLDTGAFQIVEKSNWDISNCYFSSSGRYRVISINEEASTVVRVFDQETGEQVRLPELPNGQITNIVFSHSEKYMLFYANGDKSPTELYLYDFENGSYNKITNSLSLDIDIDHLVDSTVVRYPSFDGAMIPALYYKPKGIKPGQKIPAMIWIHGGPGGQSKRSYNFLIQYMVNHGYAVLAVNNRGSTGYGKSFFKAADLKHGDADLKDCIAGKYFLISTGDIAEDKIGIMGGSYGGYLTLAALTFQSEEMAVGIDIFGVSNWVRTLKSIPSWWESEREALYKKIGNPETDIDYLESISPLFHAKNITKPLLVIQGANDPRVLKIESDQIIEQISQNGIPYRYVVFDDEGHGFAKKQSRLIAGQTILEFLDEHLKGIDP